MAPKEGIEGTNSVESDRSDLVAPTTIAVIGGTERTASGHTLSHAVLQVAKKIEEALRVSDLRRALDLVARLRALATP